MGSLVYLANTVFHFQSTKLVTQNLDDSAGCLLFYSQVYIYIYVQSSADISHKIDPTRILCSDKVWFHLNGYANSQNNNNPVLIHEVPLHDIKVDVWHARSAAIITGPPIFFQEHKFTMICYTHTATIF